MKTLIFTGTVDYMDKEPLVCCKEVDVTSKRYLF